MIKISIGNKEYNVQEAKTSEEKIKGLLNIKELPENEGMLFYFNPEENVLMWMKNVLIPLDIIYINDDQEVIHVYQAEPGDEKKVGYEDTSYVLEVNKDSGIKIGDELEFEDDKSVTMKVLAPDGSVQMEIEGGERIFSRNNTKILIKKAKKADISKDDKDYKALGKYMFKCIKILDERPAEYVNNPK